MLKVYLITRALCFILYASYVGALLPARSGIRPLAIALMVIPAASLIDYGWEIISIWASPPRPHKDARKHPNPTHPPASNLRCFKNRPLGRSPVLNPPAIPCIDSLLLQAPRRRSYLFPD